MLAALIGGTCLVAATSDANAYVVKRTSRGELVHWEQRAVSYTIDPSVDSNVGRGADATIISMDSWSGTVGAPELHVMAPTAESPTKPGYDEKNGVFFIRGGYAPAGKALAITVLTYDNASGRILDADVIVNGVYNFEVLRSPDEPAADNAISLDTITHEDEVMRAETIYDLQHVVAHELGHSLGMNDEMGRRDALMYRYSAPNDATLRGPAPDDIAGLAELYSARVEAHGNGCGSATVAPKAPSRTASNAAAFATLAFLLFLVLRAKSDRRARAAFVFAAAAAAIAFVPNLSGGKGIARASEGAQDLGDSDVRLTSKLVGHARARVLGATTAIENGLFKTQYKLATTTCNTGSCPKAGHGAAWGGTIGNITQEVGGEFAPAAGDDVDVSFASLPNKLAALSQPFAGRTGEVDTKVRVVTRARQ